MRKCRAVAWVLTAFWGAACAAPIGYNFTGPVSPYYVTTGNMIAVIQGTRVIRTIPFAYGGAPSEGVFAISGPTAGTGTIRTRASEPADLGNGGTYTLAGAAQGAQYTTPFIPPGRSYDGTTDGEFNYYTDHWRGVYRTDPSWQNPEFLFDPYGCTPEWEYQLRCDSHGLSGIAYDSLRNTLWISAVPDAVIWQYSLDGRLLSAFPTTPLPPWSTLRTGNAALAYDPADDTLWLVRMATGEFQQWSTAGILLQSTRLKDLDPRLATSFAYGAEFQVIPTPEPATFALLAIGLALLTARRFSDSVSRKDGSPRG